MQQNSKAWMYFAGLSFTAALVMIWAGIMLMPTDVWVKAYLAMGTLFLVTSSFTLSKTVRDTNDQRNRAARINKRVFDRIMRESDMGLR